jgi:hypothetical protein
MLLAALAAAGVCVAPALAQSGGKPGATPRPATTAQPTKPTTTTPHQQPAGMPSMDEMMKMTGPVAEHHQLQQQLEGSWDVTCAFRMGPDAPENTSTGTSENKMVLGGRYLSQHFKGTMNMPGMGEMPFEGMGISGFDRAKNQWFGTWIDNMGTGQMQMTGTYDEATKTYTYKGSYEDPAMGHVDTREVVRIESPDKHVMEFYMPAGPGGQEFKSMTITYTRSKAGGQPATGRTNAPASGRAPGATPRTGGRP